MITTKNNTRQQRVSIEIKKILSEFLLKNSIVDVNNICDTTLISITDVSISACLQHAKVFVVPISNKISNDECIEFLDKHKAKLKNQIASSMRMKYVPELCFFIDHSSDNAAKLDALFKKIKST